MKDSTVVLIAGLAFLIAGVVMAYTGLRARKLSAASMTWPTTPGRIVSSAVRRGAKGAVSVIISYTYAVADQSFTGNNAKFGGVVGLNEANRIVAAYPADSDATVYYNPDKPSQAVLEPGGKGGAALAMMIVGALMLAFTIASVVLFANLAAQGR